MNTHNAAKMAKMALSSTNANMAITSPEVDIALVANMALCDLGLAWALERLCMGTCYT